MAQKWINVDGKLRVSASVTYHFELLPKERPESMKILGGGLWWKLEDEPAIIFYRCSSDYGFCSKENLIKALPESFLSIHWEGFKVYHSEKVNLGDALLNKELIYTIPE